MARETRYLPASRDTIPKSVGLHLDDTYNRCVTASTTFTTLHGNGRRSRSARAPSAATEDLVCPEPVEGTTLRFDKLSADDQQ